MYLIVELGPDYIMNQDQHYGAFSRITLQISPQIICMNYTNSELNYIRMVQRNLLNHQGINIQLTGILSHVTIYRVIQLLNVFWPEMKRILVDKRDEDLFKDIMANKGKVF